ncbi:MAG: type II toxin-antitoxin system Phd/YefM family antitoxin [Terracidiphilus sp.]
MRFSTQIKPISYVKANAAELLERIRQEREPIIITQNGEARAVLMDIHSYEEQLETLNLLKAYAASQADAQTGEAYSVDEAVAELRRRRASRSPGLEPLFK